LTSVNPG